ncbi:MAG TPA: hypothetical protein VHN17_00705 [Steroidobacteraceae bacterium]|nr:hypothetical protein [Steroidobacteraceae bacterium]
MTASPYRPRAALGALLVCAVTLPLLSGCTVYSRVFHRGGKNFAGCTERPFAGNTDSRATLKVPEGMSAPDTRNAVKIPALSTADPQTGKTEPCLAQPPNFFSKPLPLEQPTKGKKSRAPANPTAPAPAPAPASTPPAAPTAPEPAAPSAPSTAPPVTPPQDAGPG